MDKPLIKVPIKYGAAAALLVMILFVALYYSGRHPLSIPVFFDVRLLILPLFMTFAMKEFRDFHNDRVLHFWQGLTIGFITFTIIGSLVSVFIIILSNIDPSFLTSYIEERVYLLETNKQQFIEALNEDIIAEQLRTLPLTTSIDLALDYFLKSVGMGVFLNIIISVILRRQPKLT